MKNKLILYKQLLRDYHRAINYPDWPDTIKPLVIKMDIIWVQLSKKEQSQCLEYAQQLYLERIK